MGKYPSDLPVQLRLRFKAKGLQTVAAKLAEIKKRKGCATYAKTIEMIIEDFDTNLKLADQLKRNLQAEKDRADRLRNALDALKRA